MQGSVRKDVHRNIMNVKRTIREIIMEEKYKTILVVVAIVIGLYVVTTYMNYLNAVNSNTNSDNSDYSSNDNSNTEDSSYNSGFYSNEPVCHTEYVDEPYQEEKCNSVPYQEQVCNEVEYSKNVLCDNGPHKEGWLKDWTKYGCSITNLESEGGTFAMNLGCYFEGAKKVQTVVKYIFPGQTESFDFEIKLTGAYDCFNEYTQIPTNTVCNYVTKYRQECEYVTNYHTVEKEVCE